MKNIIDNILNEMFENESSIINEAKNNTASMTNANIHNDIAKQWITKRDDAKSKWQICKDNGDTKRANFWHRKYVYYESKRREARNAQAVANDNATNEMVTFDEIISNYMYYNNANKTLNENVQYQYYGLPHLNMYPLDNADNVNNAIKYFNYVEPQDEAILAKNIIESLNRLNMEYPLLEESNRFDKYLLVNISRLEESNRELVDVSTKHRMSENKLVWQHTQIPNSREHTLSYTRIKDAIYDGPTGVLIRYLNGDTSVADSVNVEAANKIAKDGDVVAYLRQIMIELRNDNPDIDVVREAKMKIRQAYNLELSKRSE